MRRIMLSAISFLSFVAVILSLSNHVLAFKLPDTGQTKCYQSVSPYAEIPCAGTGQDGAYHINPMSYTDNGNGTVTDNNTGLMWQQGENPTIYNWYKASGTYDASYNSSSQNVCGELRTGSYSDWRLPTKKELITIVDYSVYPGPAIKTAYFPNAYASTYWSSTTDASNPGYAWDVYFNYGGSVDYLAKYWRRDYVRCVRGGQLDFGNFIDNYDGTITDNSTGLMWQQGELGSMLWPNALTYCENLELPSGSGQSDWRLPNIKELESITDDSRYNPAIDPVFTGRKLSNYWSSTTISSYPYYAWYVNFKYGYVDVYWYYWSNGMYVRCVRGGEAPQYTLTVNGSGNGSGTVSETGIDCTITNGASGGDCSEVYDEGTPVSLTPLADAGYTFTGWSGDCDADGEVTMDADKTCTATFTCSDPYEIINDLYDSVNTEVAQRAIRSRLESPLDSCFNRMPAAIDGDIRSLSYAVRYIEQFKMYVNKYIKTGEINGETGAELLQTADELIASFTCDDNFER